jgi:hypothetical protein
MRITEMSLRKIVRDMLKEALSQTTPVGTPGVPAAVQPPAPDTGSPWATPKAVKNPKVAQFQKIIGATPNGIWDQTTQAQFMYFVRSKIGGGVNVIGSNNVPINADALSDWKNVAGQIKLVGIYPAPQGFTPNIDGLINFITKLNSNESMNRAAVSPATTDLANDQMTAGMENEYFAWNQPNNPKNAYFTPPGVDDMSDMGPNFGQPVPHAAYFEQPNSTSTRRNVFKRQPRKK